MINDRDIGSPVSTTPDSKEIDLEISRKFWDERATSAADPRSVTLDQQPRWLSRVEIALYQGWLFRRLPRRRLGTIVDLACGNGDWTVELAKRCEHIVAADFSQGFVDACRVRLGEDAKRATFVCSDVVEVELPKSDLILAGGVVQYVADDRLDVLLANVRDALTPEGLFYVRVTVSKTGETTVKRDESFQGLYRTLPWYEERLDAAGFEIVHKSNATRFVADEASRKVLGPLHPVIYYPLLSLRRFMRRKKPTEIAVWILRRKSEKLLPQ